MSTGSDNLIKLNSSTDYLSNSSSNFLKTLMATKTAMMKRPRVRKNQKLMKNLAVTKVMTRLCMKMKSPL